MSDGMHNKESGDLEDYRCDPDEVQNAGKVCAQCKHFYVRLNELGTTIPEDRNANEIRLCYEIHWCNAASPVCDDDFDPLTTARNVIRDMFDDLQKEADTMDLSSSEKPVNFDHFGHRELPKPQKEIQYVYIGLLRRLSSDGELVEVPAEIDDVATNYRRVEMGPLDWDLSFIDKAGRQFRSDDWGCTLSAPNTATNAVEIRFPDPQTNWKSLTHFGVYDSLVGGKLIKTKDIKPYPTDWGVVCWAWYGAGDLELQLDVLTNEKKGGE